MGKLDHELSFHSLWLQCQLLQERLITGTVLIPEVAQDLCALVHKFAEAETVSYVAFKGRKVLPEFTNLVGFEGSYIHHCQLDTI